MRPPKIDFRFLFYVPINIHLKKNHPFLMYFYWTNTNSNVLLPPATKRVELINFYEIKQSFGLRDSADCRQRETKLSTKSAERLTSGKKSVFPDY